MDSRWTLPFMGVFLLALVLGSARAGPENFDPLGGLKGQAEDGGRQSRGRERAGYYRVKPGDTLWDIARRFFGSPFSWRRIFESNRGQISNPHWVNPGQVLEIPGGGSEAPEYRQQVERARQAGPGPKPGAGATYGLPLAAGRITSNYGSRTLRGKADFHGGIDIAVPTGTTVYSTAPGRVKFVGWKGGYGRLVIVEHDDGSETYYAHLLQGTVKAGDTVAQGQPIALSDNTGNSTGPHLHYGVRRGGRFEDPRHTSSFPPQGGSFG